MPYQSETWPPPPQTDVTIQTFGQLTLRREGDIIEIGQVGGEMLFAQSRWASLAPAALLLVWIVLLPPTAGFPQSPDLLSAQVKVAVFGGLAIALAPLAIALFHPDVRAVRSVRIDRSGGSFRDATQTERRLSDVEWIAVSRSWPFYTVNLYPSRIVWILRNQSAALLFGHALSDFTKIPIETKLSGD